MEKILQSHIHVIATARGKDAYVLEEKNGKQAPRKVGEGIIGDKELEYNYTCSFQLSQDTHIASVMKDNTGIFDGRYEVLTEKDGNELYEWANKGIVVKRDEPRQEESSDDASESNSILQEKLNQIASEIESLTAVNVDKKDIAKVIKQHNIINGKPSANYKAITDIEVADSILEDLSNITINQGENE